MPMTMTLYRTIAYKKFKNILLTELEKNQSINVEEVSSTFCRTIDRDILDSQFYYTLVQ